MNSPTSLVANTAEEKLPSDDLQHIQFEGCDVCVIAPEDFDALTEANKELARLLRYAIEHSSARHIFPLSFVEDARAALKVTQP